MTDITTPDSPTILFQFEKQPEPLLILNAQGFTYKGVLIEDAGEAYKAWMEVMQQVRYG